MELRIDGKKFETWSSFNAEFAYDKIGDTFSFTASFNPDDPAQLEALKPLQYKKVQIYDEGELVLTGTALSHLFSDDAAKSEVTVSGYSLAGVLEDCSIWLAEWPREYNGLTFQQISDKVLAPFDLSLVLDPNSSRPRQAARIPYPKVKATHSQTLKSFLTQLSSIRSTILTSDREGQLVLTTPNTSGPSVAEFKAGTTGIKITSSFNGQAQHSLIGAVRQGTKKRSSAKGETSRPDIPAYRPIVKEMTSGEDTGADTAAESFRSAEYLANEITVSIDRKRLQNNILAYPGQIVTIEAPGAYILTPTRFFVRSVSLAEDSDSETAVLKCVYPESLTGEEVKF